MERVLRFSVSRAVGFVLLSAVFVAFAHSQARKPAATLFYDSDGNLISNNEFVDIRLANFHYPDRTIVKTLDDGTVEFRLQKIPQEGMQAPTFSVKTLDGRTINSSELKGRVAVLNFWFIGCSVCRAHKPLLNQLKAKFAGRDDVIFLAMTADAPSDVKKYLANEPFDYIQAADAKTAMDSFGFNGFPKNIVIGRDGRIVYWRSPVKAWEKFESVIRGALQKN